MYHCIIEKSLEISGNSHNSFAICVVLYCLLVADILEILMDKNANTFISDKFVDLQSKTQKIVTALYMVSDLIPARDPIRKELRSQAVAMSSLVASLAIQSPSRAKKTITETQNYIDTIVSLLKVSVSIGFVSDMNFKIIVDSLIFVRDDLNQKYALLNKESLASSSFHNRGVQEFVLPDFITKDGNPKAPQAEVEKTKPFVIKDKQASPIKDKMSVIKDTQVSNPSLSQREERIIAIITEKKEVSVSDVSTEFPEISEKTIQRMLIKLVEEGKLGKTGEKRWSRYSLASS